MQCPSLCNRFVSLHKVDFLQVSTDCFIVPLNKRLEPLAPAETHWRYAKHFAECDDDLLALRKVLLPPPLHLAVLIRQLHLDFA